MSKFNGCRNRLPLTIQVTLGILAVKRYTERTIEAPVISMFTECTATPVAWCNQVFDLDVRTFLTHINTINEVVGSLLCNPHWLNHVGTEMVLIVESNLNRFSLIIASIACHLEEHIHFLRVQQFFCHLAVLVISNSVEWHGNIVVVNHSYQLIISPQFKAIILNLEVIGLAAKGLAALHVIAEEVLKCSHCRV